MCCPLICNRSIRKAGEFGLRQLIVQQCCLMTRFNTKFFSIGLVLTIFCVEEGKTRMTTRARRKCHSETLMSKLLSSPACPKIAQTQHQCTVWAIFWGKGAINILILKLFCHDFEGEALSILILILCL